MENGIIAAAGGIGMLLGGVAIALSTYGVGKKKLGLEELVSLRKELYDLSKVNERARVELGKLGNPNIRSKRQLDLCIKSVREVIASIHEEMRKIALDTLAVLRSQIAELARHDSDIKRELDASYSRHVSNRSSVLREIERLEIVYDKAILRKKKVYQDKVSAMREELFELSEESSIASTILEKSYENKSNDLEFLAKQVTSMEFEIRSIKIETRKRLTGELNTVREELFVMSQRSEVAKAELDESYRKRLSDNQSVRDEIVRLRNTIADIEYSERKEIYDNLSVKRDEIYSMNTHGAERIVNESFNKKIDETLACKEIDRLEKAKESILYEQDNEKYQVGILKYMR